MYVSEWAMWASSLLTDVLLMISLSVCLVAEFNINNCEGTGRMNSSSTQG